MSDLHTIITSLGDRCPEDLRFYVETGHKAAFVVDVRRYAGRALAALCRVIREQDRMLTDACDILAADDEERVTKVMHDLGFIEENRWGPMYDAEAFNAMLRSRVREEWEDE